MYFKILKRRYKYAVGTRPGVQKRTLRAESHFRILAADTVIESTAEKIFQRIRTIVEKSENQDGTDRKN